MENIYISKNLIDEPDVSEIDMDFYDDFGFDFDLHDNIIDINQTHSLDSEPILIDRLIKILQELKLAGANYVQLEDNCDHHGYDVEAFHIRLATSEEIENYHKRK